MSNKVIIFLYGPDAYRSKQKLDEIVAHYKEAKKSGLNLLYLDAEQIDFLDFYNHFKISSMFAEKKLVVLRNIFSNKQFQEEFLKELKSIEALPDVIVIHESEEVDQRLKLFKTLTKDCKSQEFAYLDGKKLKLWAQHELQKLQAKINIDALDLLISYVGNDLWRLENEMQKLAAYKQGSPINKADVELHVRANLQVDIFKTIDALAQKNKKQALALLHKHLDAGEAPLYILSMIAWQFKNLLVVKELAQKGLMYASIVKKSGLHPFVVKKNYFICNQFSFEELQHIYQAIFRTDTDIKTGVIEPETALDMLAAKI